MWKGRPFLHDVTFCWTASFHAHHLCCWCVVFFLYCNFFFLKKETIIKFVENRDDICKVVISVCICRGCAFEEKVHNKKRNVITFEINIVMSWPSDRRWSYGIFTKARRTSRNIIPGSRSLKPRRRSPTLALELCSELPVCDVTRKSEL